MKVIGNDNGIHPSLVSPKNEEEEDWIFGRNCKLEVTRTSWLSKF